VSSMQRPAIIFELHVGQCHLILGVLRTVPDHEALGMPALSPTMEQGNIAEWAVKEGQSVSAGDVLAMIETDKASHQPRCDRSSRRRCHDSSLHRSSAPSQATVDFECTDDGIIAKILVPAGAQDVPVGTVGFRTLPVRFPVRSSHASLLCSLWS
jgi:pyruvate dehydrogenase E2 component (dihydrolipoamide acetyltransferase)